ncbi:aldo/keto reductase [Acetobacter okinawensis]|uniref:aldo/keto reductase n=1 Tax=Acetobacter okinawensis TaxID=1076594 RepID=UPI003425DFEA
MALWRRYVAQGSDGADRRITSPIIGATKPKHLEDAVTALELKLTDEEVAELEAP